MISKPIRPPDDSTSAHYGGAVTGARRDTVEVAPGVVLAYDVLAPTGRDARPGSVPIVLLHGLSQQRAFWAPVLRRLRSGPIAALDQRGHGDSDTPLGASFSVASCAADVVTLLDALGWQRAVVAGHSWGAAVALAVAASAPHRVAASVLLDGGLWGPSGLGDRAEVRRRLTPPALGIPAEDLWALIRQGDLGDSWSAEVQDALAPTFVADADGNLRTRIGMDRHLAVLDGLLDHDATADLAAAAAHDVPVWAVVCEPSGAHPATAAEAPWREAKERGLRAASALSNCRIHRWGGAVHDVPLQWPALVAGLIDTAAEAEGGRRA